MSWSTQSAAAHFATELRKALAGESLARGEPYSKFLKQVTVTTVGGSQHLVEWQADTPGNAQTVFLMVENVDLPALPDCGKLTRAQAAIVAGCTWGIPA